MRTPSRKFAEFFTANIRNRNTRQAYARAARRFFAWCEDHRHRLEQIEPMLVAAYIEELGQSLDGPSVKQHLAAIRMLFDYLVVGQVIKMNPAAAVRGPKHVVTKGKTPVLTPEEAHELFDSIAPATIADLRDRALIGVMVYSFARVGRRRCHERRRLLPTGEAILVSAPREGRQAPRRSCPSQGRNTLPMKRRLVRITRTRP